MYQNSYNINWYPLSDSQVVKHLFNSLKQLRLDQNLSQEDLAERSGVSRITISRMESGKAINMLTYVQLLRALEFLDLLNGLIVQPTISPMMLMEQQESYRKKASPKK